MTRISKAEFARIKARQSARKDRRAENAEFQAASALLAGSGLAVGASEAAKGPGAAKRARKPRKARSERKQLVAQLDTVFSLYIRARDRAKTGGACVLGCGMIEHCAHLITRAKHSVRWDPRNATGQCAGANLRHEFDPHPYTAWYLRTFGLETYETLVRDSNRVAKFSNDHLREMLSALKSKIEGAPTNAQASIHSDPRQGDTKAVAKPKPEGNSFRHEPA